MKNRGITLVALVVTIIILLILAGITISQLTGSGLFSKMEIAEQREQEAEQEEKDKLSSYENELNKYSTWSRTGEKENSVNIMDIINYLAGKSENENLEEQIENIVNDKNQIDSICSSQEMFSICANSSVFMEKICNSQIGRTSLYDNAEVTENIIQKSEIALNVMKNSDRAEIIYKTDSVRISSTELVSYYSDKAFLFSVSQTLNNQSSKYTIIGNFIIGNQTINKECNLTNGSDGKKLEINKFISSAGMHSCYHSSDDLSYSSAGRMYIFKI